MRRESRSHDDRSGFPSECHGSLSELPLEPWCVRGNARPGARTVRTGAKLETGRAIGGEPAPRTDGHCTELARSAPSLRALPTSVSGPGATLHVILALPVPAACLCPGAAPACGIWPVGVDVRRGACRHCWRWRGRVQGASHTRDGTALGDGASLSPGGARRR